MCLPDANGRRAHCPVRAFAQRQRRAVCRLLWQRCCACTFFNKGSTCRSRPCKKRHTTRRRAPLCNSWSSPRPASAAGQNARFGLSQRPPGYVKVKYQGRARNHRPPGDAVRAPQSMDGAKANVEHGRADMNERIRNGPQGAANRAEIGSESAFRLPFVCPLSAFERREILSSETSIDNGRIVGACADLPQDVLLLSCRYLLVFYACHSQTPLSLARKACKQTLKLPQPGAATLHKCSSQKHRSHCFFRFTARLEGAQAPKLFFNPSDGACAAELE